MHVKNGHEFTLEKPSLRQHLAQTGRVMGMRNPQGPPIDPPGSLMYIYVALACLLALARSPATVRQRGMGTLLMGTILRFASVPLRKMGTDLLGSWWPCQCVLPTLTS